MILPLSIQWRHTLLCGSENRLPHFGQYMGPLFENFPFCFSPFGGGFPGPPGPPGPPGSPSRGCAPPLGGMGDISPPERKSASSDRESFMVLVEAATMQELPDSVFPTSRAVEICSSYEKLVKTSRSNSFSSRISKCSFNLFFLKRTFLCRGLSVIEPEIVIIFLSVTAM